MRCAGNSDLIHQMYIYGSSLRAYLLAAVVPSKSKSHDSTSLNIRVSCWTLASSYGGGGASSCSGRLGSYVTQVLCCIP